MTCVLNERVRLGVMEGAGNGNKRDVELRLVLYEEVDAITLSINDFFRPEERFNKEFARAAKEVEKSLTTERVVFRE